MTLDTLQSDGFDLSLLGAGEHQPQGAVPDLQSYDRAIVFFSGGKDSLALVLDLIERGFPREKIELHHHLIDGAEGSTLFDWPCTEAYCEAIAKALGLPITYSWRTGGLEAACYGRSRPLRP